jgi:hypothetical protein
MKNKFCFIASAFILFSFLNSCKKEGCMDSMALNYNEKAKNDDGSCEYNENQLAVQKLEGKWEIIEMKEDGIDSDPMDYKYIIYQYENCGNKESNCDGVMAYQSPDFNENILFTYSVSGNGKKLNIDYSSTSRTYDIFFISNNQFKQSIMSNDKLIEMVLSKL